MGFPGIKRERIKGEESRYGKDAREHKEDKGSARWERSKSHEAKQRLIKMDYKSYKS